MVHVMYNVELHKSEDVRAICKDQHVEKKMNYLLRTTFS